MQGHDLPDFRRNGGNYGPVVICPADKLGLLYIFAISVPFLGQSRLLTLRVLGTNVSDCKCVETASDYPQVFKILTHLLIKKTQPRNN